MSRIDLFILTGRRINLFRDTISSFVEMNPSSTSMFQKVWILDDRSSWADRIEMVEVTKSHFGEVVSLITFDNGLPFMWVDKFNCIGKLSEEGTYVFVLEDDWKCREEVPIENIIQYMEQEKSVTQVSLCDPIWIQEDRLQKKHDNDSPYWENPWPNEFRHISDLVGKNKYAFSEVRMNNYTNNPSVTRSSVFKNNLFKNTQSFEHDFADSQVSPKQMFYKRLLFDHIGNEVRMKDRI